MNMAIHFPDDLLWESNGRSNARLMKLALFSYSKNGIRDKTRKQSVEKVHAEINDIVERGLKS